MTSKDATPIWQIETGGQVWYKRAMTWQQAIIEAWAKRGPKSPGIFVRLRAEKSVQRKDRRWGYVDIAHALKIAGYSIKESR